MDIITIAKQELGYAETGNNNTKYGGWYGLQNNPWCAMFISWVFNEAGQIKYVAASSKKGFASCAAGLNWFAKKNKLVPVGQAKQGDIAFFQFDTDAEPDHVGIVLRNNTITKTLVCIEGNTSGNSKGSQANGGGVYKKKRPYKHVMAVARPIKEKNETKTTTSTQVSSPSLCSNCGQPLPSGSNRL
jgi:hypothetical protein